MQSGPKRHTKRHNAQRAKLGKWKRHLLSLPYQLEVDGAAKPARVTWGAEVVIGLDSEAKQSSWSAAARALSSLEIDGMVAVEPPRDKLKRNQRRVVRSYRLTPAGRRRAAPKLDRPMTRGQALGRRDAARRRRAIENELDRLAWDTDFLPRLISRLRDVAPVGSAVQRSQSEAADQERDVAVQAALLLRDLLYMKQIQASFNLQSEASRTAAVHIIDHDENA